MHTFKQKKRFVHKDSSIVVETSKTVIQSATTSKGEGTLTRKRKNVVIDTSSGEGE